MRGRTADLATIAVCRSCASPGLLPFLDLGRLPLSDGLLSEAQLVEDEPLYPLIVVFCPSCTLVQILHTVPPEELFGANYPYFSSFSDVLVQHAAENVAARLVERELGAESLVVELASNDGYLLQHYAVRGIPVIGIDPAPGPAAAARAKGIRTIEAFFGPALARSLAGEGLLADVIHANNVLAHVADTNGFVAAIARLLKPQGVAVIEVPYVRELIEHTEFDTIYHEHLCYFSVTALDRLFCRHGLGLTGVEQLWIHGGSLRLFAKHQGRPGPSIQDLLNSEAAQGLTGFPFYKGFSRRVGTLCAELKALTTQLKARGAAIAAYGAAAKGTILLNHVDLGRDIIDFVVDRNHHKQGKWIPGVRLPILAPEAVLERQPDYLLILPWNFKDEIMTQQAEYARRGGRFILSVPRPQVVLAT
jgi:SAM-dependent methyltransferase